METNKNNIKKILVSLFPFKKFIFKWAIGGGILGVIIAFSIPQTYSVSAVVAPELNNSGSTLASFASLAGFNLSNVNMTDAIDPSLFPEISTSIPFLQALLYEPVTSLKDSVAIPMKEYIKKERSPWFIYILNAPQYLIEKFDKKETLIHNLPVNEDSISRSSLFISRKEMAYLLLIQKSISVSQNAKTGLISVKASFQDPMVTTQIAEAMLRELQKFMLIYKTNKAANDLEYIKKIEQERLSEYTQKQKAYAQFVDQNKQLAKESGNIEKERLLNDMQLAYSVLTQTMTQRYAAEGAYQEKKPSFVIIDPPLYPLEPNGKRKLIVFFYIFLAVSISSFWVLYGKKRYSIIRNYITKNKKRMTNIE